MVYSEMKDLSHYTLFAPSGYEFLFIFTCVGDDYEHNNFSILPCDSK